MPASFTLPVSLLAVAQVLRACFTAPSFEVFTQLLAGMVVTRGPRTVTGMLTGAGLSRAWSHHRVHRFFSRAAWDPRKVGQALAAAVIETLLPAGVAGPEAMDFDVRCFLVPHASGLVLVDTGLPGSAQAIGTALAELGAAWSDLTDILLSHDHPDHVGALADVLTLAPAATVWGNAPLSARALADGDRIQGLQVIATPGHTAGHVSLLHESGALLVGDLVGSAGDRLVRAPAPFTADPEEAERSLRRIADIRADRLLPAHGAEVSHPFQALAELVDQNPTNGGKPE